MFPLFLALHLLHRVLLANPQAAFRLLRVLALLYMLARGLPVVEGLHKSPPIIQPRPSMPPRCCTTIPDEFRPSYASVLVFGPDPGKLQQAVQAAESRQRLTSCFTAWCSRCSGPYLLTTDLDAFPTPSAHHAHQLVLLSVLRESGALVPSEPV